MYSLYVSSFSAGVTVMSSSPAVLNGVQPMSVIFLDSSEDDSLKYNLTFEVDLTFCVNLTSKAVDKFSSTTGLVT